MNVKSLLLAAAAFAGIPSGYGSNVIHTPPRDSRAFSRGEPPKWARPRKTKVPARFAMHGHKMRSHLDPSPSLTNWNHRFDQTP